MPFFQAYLLVAAGIALSVLIPILRKLLPVGSKAKSNRTWTMIKPYVIVGVFSLATALLVLAFAGDSLTDWRAALLAGYVWDSTLQKIGT